MVESHTNLKSHIMFFRIITQYSPVLQCNVAEERTAYILRDQKGSVVDGYQKVFKELAVWFQG